MTTLEILDRLQGDALKDGELRKKLLATRLEKDPLTVFCRLCRELGYELYEMDLVSAGEDFYATMRRSSQWRRRKLPEAGGEMTSMSFDGKPGGSRESRIELAQIDINYECFR